MFGICNHLKTPLKFIKNIHGDMIYAAGGKRSIWKCTDCGKTILRDEVFYIGEVSDGYHTFNELYHHRAVLFSVICNGHPDMAWKSKLHHDGTMYDGMFIVGVNTPDGQATYHYDIDPYWNMFQVPELPNAPEWDGHTPAQAIERLSTLAQPENNPLTLDELRQMEGEPAFVTPINLHEWICNPMDGKPEWGMVRKSWVRIWRSETADLTHTDFDFEDYGKTWRAYRHKPERSEG